METGAERKKEAGELETEVEDAPRVGSVRPGPLFNEVEEAVAPGVSAMLVGAVVFRWKTCRFCWTDRGHVRLS